MPSFTTCCWPKRRSRLFRLAVDSAAKGHHETSAPTSSASSRWRCRTAGCLSGRKGASLSVAAGASSALHQVAGRTSPQGPEQSRHRKVRNFLQRDAAFYPGDSGGLTGPCAWQTHRHQHCFPWRWQDRSGHGLAIPIDMVRSVSIGSSKPAICVAVISLSASNSKPLWLATRTRYGTAEAFIMVVILAVVSGWPANRNNWSS